ncbi:MAG: polysaccharide deacetylase family protein [Gemmatimonadota bacterium]
MSAPSWTRDSVPVLMYHDITDDAGAVPQTHRGYTLATACFLEQLHALADLSIRGLKLEDVLPRHEMTKAIEHPACVLTFDDGHESNYTTAMRSLQDAGFRATFFITVGWVGSSPYMTWEQIRTLAGQGMEIGSHSMTHRPPATLKLAELRAEMRDSKKALEDRLGRPVLSASSPTGFFNPSLPSVCREVGYRALCLSRIGLWRECDDPYAVPRIPVKRGMSLADFRRLVLGDPHLLSGLRRRQVLRDALKRYLGVDRYLRLRRCLLPRRLGPP